MIRLDIPEEIFPAAPALERVFAWWFKRPEGRADLEAAAGLFFGAPEALPSDQDEEQLPDLVRFMEWLLLDRPMVGDAEPPAAVFAREAKGAARVGLVALLGARHDVWRVEDIQSRYVSLKPLGGGPDLKVDHPGLAEDAEPGEALVARFYPWEGGWLPSLGLFFIPAPALEPGSVPPLDALMAQELFFLSQADGELDPAEAALELDRLVALFGLGFAPGELAQMAIAERDPRAFLEAFMTLADAQLSEEQLAEHLKEWRRMGPLLVNFWQAQPRAELDGKSHSQLAKEAESLAREGVSAAIDAVFAAIASEDAERFGRLLDPDGELALVFDLWGWPGVHLLTDWGAPTGARELLEVEEDMGALAAEVVWAVAGSRRGATLWFLEQPGGFLLTEAVAEVGTEDLVSPAYAAAQDKGLAMPWRAETSDPVERKLRNSLAARKLPMLDQATMIKAWRMVAPELSRDVGAPEAWAAAIEAYFRHSLGQDLSPNQVADFYGAKKTLVKQRFAAIEEKLNQTAEGALT